MVLEAGLDPSYVLDKMQMYEVRIILKNLYLKHKQSWEQTRINSYITAQGNSTKKLKATDIMQFPWDKESEDKDTSITDNDIERLRNKAKNYIRKNMKNNG